MMVERKTHGPGSLAVNAPHGIRVVVPCDPWAAPGRIGEFTVFFKLNHDSKPTVFAYRSRTHRPTEHWDPNAEAIDFRLLMTPGR